MDSPFFSLEFVSLAMIGAGTYLLFQVGSRKLGQVACHPAAGTETRVAMLAWSDTEGDRIIVDNMAGLMRSYGNVSN